MKNISWRLAPVAGALAIIAAALLWSVDGLFLRPQFYVLPAALVVFWEHFFGFLALSPFLYVYRRQIRALSRQSWLAIFWISLFGGLVGTLFITKAFFAAFAGSVSFATVVILQKLQPIFALLLARLVLKEKLPRQFYLWAGLAIAASYVLAFAASGLDIRAIDWRHSAALFAFIAAFAFGSSTVFGKRIANHLNFRAVAALRFALTSLLSLILLLATGAFRSDLIAAYQWWLLLLIVFTSGAGAMFIYYFGLRRVSASAATILELFWPFSALILDYVFNHNYLNLAQSLAFFALLFAFLKVSVLSRHSLPSFSARVIRGQGRGRGLGFPTANLDRADLDMPHGIYAVSVGLGDRRYGGLMHFGFKDVFKEDVSMEVFIKDFSGDIYGEVLQVKVLQKIREVRRFENQDELIAAINGDLQVLEALGEK
ncbi:MAG: riboflavin kinase [Patescibacteria group bacterium]|nr:riboflavin kinase [Patescibacteria group bacterium]